MAKTNRQQVEFGDFQTPYELAAVVTQIVANRGHKPKFIVEPTCGTGNFLLAALEQFPDVEKVLGLEINPEYFQATHQKILKLQLPQTIDLRQADFFTFNWPEVFKAASQPILVIGNPPWVTASELGAMRSKNLPAKSNFQNHRGLDAMTGKSNFDIAQWMMTHLLQWLSRSNATVAMLLKTSVARKVLIHAWKEDLPLADVEMYTIDAKKHFGVGVDACLFVCSMRQEPTTKMCKVFNIEAPHKVNRTIAFDNGMLLADSWAFHSHENLFLPPGTRHPYSWRSGIKHDCSRVMELRLIDDVLINGHEEEVRIEPDYLYPMQKGSDVANGRKKKYRRYMVVTQKQTGEPTDIIRHIAPKTWKYLTAHTEAMDNRRSSIYKNRPRFSIFGVGPYSFAPWKVAICSLYKKLQFSLVGSSQNRPVVFDDTVYFLSCKSKEEAALLLDLLHSQPAQEFLNSFIFWDAKRPITVEILSRLDILALVEEMGVEEKFADLRPDISSTLMPAARLPLLFQSCT